MLDGIRSTNRTNNMKPNNLFWIKFNAINLMLGLLVIQTIQRFESSWDFKTLVITSNDQIWRNCTVHKPQAWEYNHGTVRPAAGEKAPAGTTLVERVEV